MVSMDKNEKKYKIFCKFSCKINKSPVFFLFYHRNDPFKRYSFVLNGKENSPSKCDEVQIKHPDGDNFLRLCCWSSISRPLATQED